MTTHILILLIIAVQVAVILTVIIQTFVEQWEHERDLEWKRYLAGIGRKDKGK